VVTAESDRAVIASLRNLPKTKALPAAYLNVVDMLNHQGLLMTEDAVRIAEQLWAVKAAPKAAPAKPVRKPRAAKAEVEPEVKVEAIAEEAPVEVEPEEAPKPRRRTAPKSEAAQATKSAPKAKAEAPKPARAARKPKAEAKKPEAEKKPAPRRRTTKKTEGEG
jgi:hypothetical protein